MPTTIESLELQVQQNATSAVGGIDALSASLSRLKNAIKGGVGLNSVANQVRNLDIALKSVDGSAGDKIVKLADSLSKLKGLGNIKLSSSIGNQLKNISNVASALNTADLSGLDKLSSALRPLNDIGKASGLKSVITQLQKLPQLAQAINGINWATFSSQLQQLSNSLAPLTNQLNTASNALGRLPTNIRQVVTATNTLTETNDRAATSYVNLWAKFTMAIQAVKTGARVIASWITESNSYIENLNLFNASMGEYTEEARRYAEQVGEIMGIDPGQFMRYQGIFMTITEGFGVVSDRAYIMSKNLTQLGYDLSSFFNISFTDAMQKLESGIAGELEPLRRLGYDLSQARLEQEALNLGIEKNITDMTQAEKAQIRYHAIMTQVTTAQGDMARTLNAPANQLRILQAQVVQAARALGNIFIPILNAVLPYAIAFAKAIRIVATAIASFFGFELPEVDYSGISAGASAVGNLADNADNATSGLGDASKAAKKLKNNLLGIDELNIISQDDGLIGGGIGGGGIGGGIGGGGIGGDLDFDLPEYDFLADAVNAKVEEIMKTLEPFLNWIKIHLDDIFKTAIATGTAIASWKVAKSLISFIEWFKELRPKNLTLKIEFKVLGLAMFLADLNEFMKYFEDFEKNGVTFQNIAGMISEFTGLVGDSLIILGQLKLGGALKVVQGIGEIIVVIIDISKNDVDWETIGTAIRGLTNIAIGIGIFTKNIKFVAWSVAIQGFTSIITELAENWDAIKQGKWDDVDKVTLIIGGLEILGSLVTALVRFSRLRGLNSMGQAISAVQNVTETTESLDTATGTLSPKLSSLAKNLGLGLVVVTEVAAAALLIVGAIILLGMELEQVGIAWQPVIANGNTVVTAIGLGTGILVAVGVATAALGAAGTTLIVKVALGTAVLAEVGVATAAFIAEVWGIGYGLDKIGQSWQPVLSNGESIATAIGLGTGILVAVGVATAALGAATVTSAGSLPIAIGLGTAILVELGVATAAFLAEIWGIAKGLTEIGKAWEPILNNGETVSTGIEKGTSLLIAVGVATAALGAATVASAGLLPVAIGLGTAILVELSGATVAFTESLVTVADEMTDNLAPTLKDFALVLPKLSGNMNCFTTYMSKFAGYVVTYSLDSSISAIASTIETIVGWFTKDPIEKLADDVEEIGEQAGTLKENLNTAVPTLRDVNTKLSSYSTLLSSLDASIASMTELSDSKGGSLKTDIEIKVGLEKSGWSSLEDWIGEVPEFKQEIGLKKSGWTSVKEWIGTLPVISQDISLRKSNWTTVKNWIGALPVISQGISLIKSGWTTVENWIGNIPILSQGIALLKFGWITVKGWIGNIPTLSQGISLVKSGWTTVKEWIGTISTISQLVSLSKSGWSTVSDWVNDHIGGSVTVTVNLKKGWEGTLKKWLGLEDGGIIGADGSIQVLQSGGIIKGIPRFAGGTSSAGAHGSLFVAGENGAEMVAHINGQTEVLNRFQMATIMRNAVISGMSQFVGYWRSMNSQMVICTNGIIRSILVSSDILLQATITAAYNNYDPTNTLVQSVYEDSQRSYNNAYGDNTMMSTMKEFYREYVEPILQEISVDTKRQADKNEQTFVQISNKTINDAVVTQQNANGYVFAK